MQLAQEKCTAEENGVGDGATSNKLLAPLRLTPEQFAQVCAKNRQAVLEQHADGRNTERLVQLQGYSTTTGAWTVFESCRFVCQQRPHRLGDSRTPFRSCTLASTSTP